MGPRRRAHEVEQGLTWRGGRGWRWCTRGTTQCPAGTPVRSTLTNSTAQERGAGVWLPAGLPAGPPAHAGEGGSAGTALQRAEPLLPAGSTRGRTHPQAHVGPDDVLPEELLGHQVFRPVARVCGPAGRRGRRGGAQHSRQAPGCDRICNAARLSCNEPCKRVSQCDVTLAAVGSPAQQQPHAGVLAHRLCRAGSAAPACGRSPAPGQSAPLRRMRGTCLSRRDLRFGRGRVKPKATRRRKAAGIQQRRALTCCDFLRRFLPVSIFGLTLAMRRSLLPSAAPPVGLRGRRSGV